MYGAMKSKLNAVVTFTVLPGAVLGVHTVVTVIPPGAIPFAIPCT